jgi:ribosomal protein S6
LWNFFFKLDFNTLTSLVKSVSHKVVEGGGIVRSIRNHGIRDLPHKFRAKYPDTQGNRYYKKGRFVSIYYDASPLTMRAVEASISLNDCVLRQTHLKTRSKLDLVNVRNEKKNPYILKLKRQEEEEEEAIKNIQERADAEDDLVNAVSRAYETE